MNTNDLNTALYEKMAAEQDKYRDWLKSQPPEEILHHTYEYTIREDIVMAMEELELTDAQAQALLESPSPLEDVYRYFEKLETGYMDVIRDSIENRADDVCRAKEELRTTPVYPHSAAYAREHGELEQYRASNNVNRQCKESIEAAVREHFDGMYLSHDAAKGVIETYGMERVSMVLSNTIQLQDWDGRYSRRNKEWAKTIPNDNPETVRCGYALNSHPAVLDGFIDLVREEQQRSRTQREKLEPSRPSVRDKLKQELPPYHKPAFRNILYVTFQRTLDIFLRALRVISLVSIVFFVLTYGFGGSVESSILYKVGVVIDPVTRFFGLKWQAFLAFCASAISKESLLGVLNTLYGAGGSLVSSIFGAKVSAAAAGGISEILAANFTKAEGLAFIFAISFNMPCVSALAATAREAHSVRWTAKIGVFYTLASLLIACIVYHIGVLLF